MRIVVVSEKSGLHDWMQLPWRIYRKDPTWIPHLKQDVAKVFDPAKNKRLVDGKAKRWVIYDDANAPIGRIAAFIDPKTAHADDLPTGGIGFFECVNEQAVANRLFNTAKEWLQAEGMQAMDGPINLGDRNMFWGLLTKNFTDPPIYGTNYNPPYYVDLFEHYGFQVYFDQLFFKLSAQDPVHPLFHRKYKQIVDDPEYRVADVRGRSVKQIAEDFRTVLNAAWVDHEGFKPMEAATALKLVKSMKPVMDPRLIIFVYHREVPIAMYVSLPELNEIFRHVNGNLNWLGKLIFLWHKKIGTVKTMTGIVFGVAKEYQGKGIEGVMIVHGEKTFVKDKLYQDTVLTWIGDFNPKMIKVCQNLGAENYRTLSTYRYHFDRNRAFTRHPIIGRKES